MRFARTFLIVPVLSAMFLLAGARVDTAEAHVRIPLPATPTTVRQVAAQGALRRCRYRLPCTRYEFNHHLNHILTAWHFGGWDYRAPSAHASWYTLYGNTTANGTMMYYGNRVIAHRSLPFGTVCRLSYNGRKTWGIVKDRGPFVTGRTFDLEKSLRDYLRFGGVANVKYHCRKY